MAKTPAKKSASKKKATTPSSVSKLINLSVRQTAAAKKCLERSGKITLGFKEITLTKLPKSIGPVLTFVD